MLMPIVFPVLLVLIVLAFLAFSAASAAEPDGHWLLSKGHKSRSPKSNSDDLDYGIKGVLGTGTDQNTRNCHKEELQSKSEGLSIQTAAYDARVCRQ
jgi:hypothetical protein